MKPKSPNPPNPKIKLLWTSTSRLQYLWVPDWVEQAVRNQFPELEVVIARDPETVHKELEDCEILVSWTLRPEQFARCRKLKWIHSPAAGVTSILPPGLAESAVTVTNSTSVHAVPVAEHTIALLFALSRRLLASFRHQAERRWEQGEGWEAEHCLTEINGKTLGLVGLGAIGREVAARAKALGMRVSAVKRDPTRGGELADRVYAPPQLHALLAETDFLVLAVPDTPENIGLMNEAAFQAMKPTAYLINIARGTLVNTDALMRALESGQIAGAALDVTDPEPLPPEHPLWQLPNVLITAHLGSATERFWKRSTDLLAENLRRYLAGEPLLNPVDKGKGY